MQLCLDLPVCSSVCDFVYNFVSTYTGIHAASVATTTSAPIDVAVRARILKHYHYAVFM